MTEHDPGQLILRPFFDQDVSRIQCWLYAPHVAPWFEHPEDWLSEVQDRDGKFSFLTHLIAEVDGIGIGFCQYYDCFDAREHENWGFPMLSPHEVYSIDYLIGETAFLRHGYGKEIIRQLLRILTCTGARKVIVKPARHNEASNRSLLANGFIWNGNHYLYNIEGEDS